MRATIVVDDNVMLIDGVPQTIDCSQLLTQNIHAVQWSGSSGEEEFRVDPETGHREPNNRITDFSPYQPYIDQWQAKQAKSKINPTLDKKPIKTSAQILGV